MITVERDTAVWEQTSRHGRRARERPSRQRKVFALSAAERQKLHDAIAANELLTPASLALPQRPPVFYFDLRMVLELGAETGAIAIAGPRSAVEFRGNKVYRRSMNFVRELHGMLNAHDPSIVFEEPLR